MIIKYAIVDRENQHIESVAIGGVDSQYTYVFDFMETEISIDNYSDDKYFMCAFPKDWHSDFTEDNVYFVVVKINKDGYFKREKLFADGVISDGFWLSNEIFESFEDMKDVPTFEELCGKTENGSIYT